MGDPAGQPADSFHFPGLGGLGLGLIWFIEQVFRLFLRFPLIGDIQFLIHE
jgi:hypothetical protein